MKIKSLLNVITKSLFLAFTLDKIDNFVNYYPNFNIDFLISKNRKKEKLVFARETRQRSVS